MKKFGISNEQADTLSYAVSEYVNGLGANDWIEGIFVMPCGEEKVDSVVVGVVYNNWKMGQIIEASNKNRLHMLGGSVGIGLQLRPVSYDKCCDYFAYRSYEQPIKGMVKTGAIIYDAEGRLHMLQDEYRRDASIASLESRGAVEMEPAIQYTKKPRFY